MTEELQGLAAHWPTCGNCGSLLSKDRTPRDGHPFVVDVEWFCEQCETAQEDSA